MSLPYKSLYTIITEQRIRRENLAAARALGLFKSANDFDVYHERAVKISNAEVKAVNQCIKAMGRKKHG